MADTYVSEFPQIILSYIFKQSSGRVQRKKKKKSVEIGIFKMMVGETRPRPKPDGTSLNRRAGQEESAQKPETERFTTNGQFYCEAKCKHPR